jgi:prepilin peptidase CpaA
MAFTLPPPGVMVVLLTLVLAAAVFDIRYRRIPNWLTVSGVIVGLGLNGFLAQALQARGLFRSSMIGLAVAFGVYFVLYAVRAMGAGDVKLMAAVGAVAGWPNWFGIFIFTAVLGGIIALIAVVLRKRLGKTLFNVGFIISEMKSGRPAYVGNEELDVRSNKAMRMPHGAVIAIGTLFFLAVSAHFTS